MHELNQGALALLVTLLPGFLALRVRDFFVPQRTRDLFERISEVVGFSLVAYSFVSAFLGLDGRPSWMLLPGETAHTHGAALEFRLDAYLQDLVMVSLLLGITVGVVEAHDLHYRLGRFLRVANRSGLRDAWHEAFSNYRERWVLIHLADGRRVRGWPVLCSEHGDTPSLFLISAAWVQADGTSEPIIGPGILITEQAGIRYAEFLSH